MQDGCLQQVILQCHKHPFHKLKSSYFAMCHISIVRGLVTQAKFLIDLQEYPTRLRKAGTSLVFFGCCMCMMAVVFSSKGMMPSILIMWPKYWDFFGKISDLLCFIDSSASSSL